MTKPSILISDDDLEILHTYQLLLRDHYEVHTASRIDETIQKIKCIENLKVAIVDLNFEGQEDDGLRIIDFIHNYYPHIATIVLSSDHDTKRVVHAMKRPVIDFIIKDENSEFHLKSALKLALAKNQNESCGINFLTHSPLMNKLLSHVDLILNSNSQSPIMILGESGTGKEHLARYVANKVRKKMLTINMATISKDTAESELFGHMKGSFTGAVSNKIGLIEQANQGILFLDEIGDASLSIQAKILRAIQEKEILPLGATQPRKVNVRFITATHHNLDEMIDRGNFRLDLFQRLNTFPICIPPLRERPEDIDFYTHTFVQEFSDNKKFQIEKEALDILKKYRWPGNVRELKNVIERSMIYASKNILDVSCLKMALPKFNEIVRDYTPEKQTDDLTLEKVINTLKQTKGNRTHAAEILNVHVSTIHRWMQRFELGSIITSNFGRPRIDSLV